MQDGNRFCALLAEHQGELPRLWLHPVHMRHDGPLPLVSVASSAQSGDVRDLLSEAMTVVTKFNADFGFQDGRWRLEQQISFGGPGLIIHASANGHADSSWTIPLCFSEVAHFSTQAGTLFLLIVLRKISKQPQILDISGPVKNFWVVGISSEDELSPQPKAALPNLLARLGLLGAVRSDLHDSYDIAQDAIGTGACANVHLGRARDPSCAKKTQIAEHEDGLVAVKIATARFSDPAVKEAGFLVRSTPHQNIIHFLGVFKVPDPAPNQVCQWAIMMEYCSGGDLHDFIMYNGPCSELCSAEIMFGLVSALIHLHSHGIVHRDVKPENILLVDHRRPVLADLGIAAYLDNTEAMAKKCGSPGHCAPEIILAQEYNAKVDVFSSGVVLYFLVSGELPFRGPDTGSVLRRTVECKLQMEEGYFRLVSSTLKLIINTFLSKNPRKRPGSSEALQQIILAYPHLKASPLPHHCTTDGRNPHEDVSQLHETRFSSRGRFTTRGTNSKPASEDPRKASGQAHLSHLEDVITNDASATGGMQDQVLNNMCQFSNQSRQCSQNLNILKSDVPVLDEGAELSSGGEDSEPLWSSEFQGVPKQRSAQGNFKRRFQLFSPAFCGNLQAQKRSLKDAARLDHQAVGHALPPGAVKLAHRRFVPLLKRCQDIAKCKKTKTNAAGKQHPAPPTCGSKITSEDARSASESDRSNLLSRDTLDRPLLDEGATCGGNKSRQLWLSQCAGVPKQPHADHNFKRRPQLSSLGFCGRLHAQNASLHNAAGLDHQAGGESSTALMRGLHHAPSPDTVKQTFRRFAFVSKRWQKHKQTNKFVADMQGIAPTSPGSKIMSEDTLAASDSDRPSQSGSFTACSFRPTFKTSNDGDGAHPSFDEDLLEDADGSYSNLGFPKPLPLRGKPGWWKRFASTSTGTPHQFGPTSTSGRLTKSPWINSYVKVTWPMIRREMSENTSKY